MFICVLPIFSGIHDKLNDFWSTVESRAIFQNTVSVVKFAKQV